MHSQSVAAAEAVGYTGGRGPGGPHIFVFEKAGKVQRDMVELPKGRGEVWITVFLLPV